MSIRSFAKDLNFQGYTTPNKFGFLTKKSENVLEKFQEKVDKASQNVTEVGKARDSQQQILQDARIEMVNIESRKDNLVYKFSSANEQIKEGACERCREDVTKKNLTQ